MIRHVVLLQPRAETTDAAMMKALEHVRALKLAIREISEVQISRNQSARHHGYTYCFEMLFFTESSLQAYLSHPAHQPVSEELQRLCGHIIDCDLVEVPPSVARPKYRDTYTSEKWRQQPGEERLKVLLMDQLDVPEEELVPSASLVEDLNADSLDLVEIWFGLREEFQVELADQDFEKILTVGDMLNFLQGQGALERVPSGKRKAGGG